MSTSVLRAAVCIVSREQIGSSGSVVYAMQRGHSRAPPPQYGDPRLHSPYGQDQGHPPYSHTGDPARLGLTHGPIRPGQLKPVSCSSHQLSVLHRLAWSVSLPPTPPFHHPLSSNRLSWSGRDETNGGMHEALHKTRVKGSLDETRRHAVSHSLHAVSHSLSRSLTLPFTQPHTPCLNDPFSSHPTSTQPSPSHPSPTSLMSP